MAGEYQMYAAYSHMPVVTPPAASSVAPLRAGACHLSIRQEPKEALITMEGKEKARKPIDPPPILELNVSHNADPQQQFLQSPYLFVAVSLFKHDKDEPHDSSGEKSLAGTLVSSLHRLKDVSNKDGGFFVFGDISVKVSGQFRLHFSLYEFQSNISEVQYLGAINSLPFHVLLPKDFKGMEESTYLSRAFSDQGVRLRLRKEPRGMMGNKRSYPYGSDQADTPIRPNLHSEYSSSYEGPTSPNKRYKAEVDDRRDSFPESVNAAPTYSPMYAQSSSYSASYNLPRQSNATSAPGYNGMALPAVYGSMATGSASAATYPVRTGFTRSVGMYNSTSLQDATNGSLPSPITQQGPYPNMYSPFSQRSTPSTAVEFSTYPVETYGADARFSSS